MIDTVRLLIIEDDPQLNVGLTLFLESEGYEVKLVGDGESGLRAVRST